MTPGVPHEVTLTPDDLKELQVCAIIAAGRIYGANGGKKMASALVMVSEILKQLIYCPTVDVPGNVAGIDPLAWRDK